MKKTFKILLLMLSLVLILGCSVISAFAEGDTDVETEEAELDFLVKETFRDAEGNLIHVLEDGSMYNSTTKQWILEKKDGIAFETDVSRMLSSLQYMWKGMLCIFVVIVVIIILTVVLNSLCGKIDEKKKLKEENH